MVRPSSVTVFCVLLALSSGALAQDTTETIASVAAGVPQLSTLWAAVQKSSLLNATRDPATAVTLFAPTNDAFAKLLALLNVTAEALLADTATLNSVLSYHVVGTPALKADLSNGQTLATLNGASLTVNISSSGDVTIVGIGSSAKVLTADTKAGKSYIHIIDTVLLPFVPGGAAPEMGSSAGGSSSSSSSGAAAASKKGAVAPKKVYYKPTYYKKPVYGYKKVYVKPAPKPSPKPSPKPVYYKKPYYKKSYVSKYSKYHG